ncbi:Mu transposase C-terminal domain-containing protein [Nitratidesulfovibrio vulgaris]|nr:Mu transposase C-terminal domain-containing protein [Nitratidesulfovibrio vulgaris]ADP87625.1 Transposase-like Mu [Nitratidesulfovibrio vulgaris RCH1]
MAKTPDAYTTQELVPLLGIQTRAVQIRAKREGWASRPRKGRGGGNEWLVASMPRATREAIADGLLRTSAPASLPATSAPAETRPALPPIDPADPRRGIVARMASLSGYTQRQREVAFARLAFIREIERLSVLTGVEAAINKLVQDAGDGALPPHLMDLVRAANDRYGDGGKRGLSRRRLYAWRAGYLAMGEEALVPKHATPDLSVPPWADAFMTLFQRPQKPSIARAHRDLCKAYATGELGELAGPPPSIHAVRRWVAKVARPDLERGRKTGNALLKMQPHQRRSTAHMLPGDCYTADGTTFDAEIRDPYNGKPMKPEITLVLDVATRRCVGVSLNYAENAQGVLDALRMACLYGGVPAMFYSDNGPGYDNRLLNAPGTGMLARLGIERRASIPGRPQGKGLMERAVKTICEPVAKAMPTCSHRDMDGDAAKKVYKITRADLKRGGRSPLLPTWEQFKTAMLERIVEYNTTPHRSLPVITDENGRRRHMSPDDAWKYHEDNGWRPVSVPADISHEEFMPAERRIVRTGEVRFGGGVYFSHDLAPYHGDAVMVRYDVWDASRVYVWTMDGRRICEAVLDANSTPYFQQSQIDAAREKREQAQLKRLERKAAAIAPGSFLTVATGRTRETPLMADSLAPRDQLPAQETAAAPVTVDVTPLRPQTTEPERRPCFAHAHERYEWLMHHKDRWLDKDEPWLRRHVDTIDYADNHERYVHEGIAWPGWKAETDSEKD